MACKVALYNVIDKLIANKPYISFNKEHGVIDVKNSVTNRINNNNRAAITYSFANQFNKKIKDLIKDKTLGDILYVNWENNVPYILVGPTDRQLNIINNQLSNNTSEVVKKDFEKEKFLRETALRQKRANEYIDDVGDVYPTLQDAIAASNRKEIENNVNNFITLEEAEQAIKDLYENPEFANKVYEALGVKPANISLNIESFGKSIDNIDIIKDGKKIGYVQISKNNTAKTLTVTGIELKEKGFGKKVYIELQRNYPDFSIKSDKTALSPDAINMWDSLVSKKLAIKEAEKEYTLDTKQALQLYSQYLDSLNKPNTNPILRGNQTNVEEIITQLEKEGVLEIDCKGKLKAEKGLQTNFTKGGKWKIIKDLKGYPTHKEGGVDLTIGKEGVKIKNGNTEFTAKHGLVIPKN